MVDDNKNVDPRYKEEMEYCMEFYLENGMKYGMVCNYGMDDAWVIHFDVPLPK